MSRFTSCQGIPYVDDRVVFTICPRAPERHSGMLIEETVGTPLSLQYYGAGHLVTTTFVQPIQVNRLFHNLLFLLSRCSV